MLAGHSRTMPLAKAVTKTFDGEMCQICRMVADAKNQERSRPGVVEVRIDNKVLLFFQAVPRVTIEMPRPATLGPDPAPMLTAGRPAPALPPPRAGLA